MRVLAAPDRPQADPIWSDTDYDLTGAHLENADFNRAILSNTAWFASATFTDTAGLDR